MFVLPRPIPAEWKIQDDVVDSSQKLLEALARFQKYERLWNPRVRSCAFDDYESVNEVVMVKSDFEQVQLIIEHEAVVNHITISVAFGSLVKTSMPTTDSAGR